LFPKFFRQKFVKEFFIICLVSPVLCIKRVIINQVLFREPSVTIDCKSYRALVCSNCIYMVLSTSCSKTDDLVIYRYNNYFLRFFLNTSVKIQIYVINNAILILFVRLIEFRLSTNWSILWTSRIYK
jgi:hypothetical protein